MHDFMHISVSHTCCYYYLEITWQNITCHLCKHDILTLNLKESESCLLIPGLDFTRLLSLSIKSYENQHPRLPSIVFSPGRTL